MVLAGWYFVWLLRPARVGNPVLYGLLVAAEVFNLVQAVGFWWTCWHGRDRADAPPPRTGHAGVDVFIPVYNEPLDVVEPTVAAAVAHPGRGVTVHLLDDAGRSGARGPGRPLRRPVRPPPEHTGAKAGNLNHALARAAAPSWWSSTVTTCPAPGFLEDTLGWMDGPRGRLRPDPAVLRQ